MSHTSSKLNRVLALAPSSRGFGYAVMEGEHILECGNKGVKGDKNLHSRRKIEKMMSFFKPDVLVLQDVNAKGCRRTPRIGALHRQIIRLAGKSKIKTVLISVKQLRNLVLGSPNGTKHEMAEALANRFPHELTSRLPPIRRAWESEDGRMGIFDAVALAVTLQARRK